MKTQVYPTPSLQCASPGLRSRKLASAPDQLIVSVKRFFKNNNWVDEEYQVPMRIDDELDLTWMKQSEIRDFEIIFVLLRKIF